jgi:DNA-binding CsgD family transcriptional regulator
VGFALLLLTDLFALWGGLPLTDVGKLELNDVLLFWAIPHILTMAVVFLVVARFSNRLIYAHVESYILVAGLVMLAGALLLVFQGFSGVTAIWMVVGSAVLIAVGSASLLSLWEYLFVDYTDEQIVRTVLVALLLSSASYLAVASIPKTAQLYLFPVIVCAAGALLFLSGRRAVKTMLSPLPSSPTSPQHKPQLLAIARLIRDPLLCVAAIMFAIAITRTVTLSNVSDANLVNIAGCVGTLLVAAALYAARYVLGGTLGSLKTFNLLRFYRVLFPALTTVLLLLPIFGSQASLLVSSLVYVGYTVSFVLILPTCMTLARQDGTHPLAVFGVFMGGTNLVFAVATGFAVVLYQANYFGAATLTVGILLALYVLAMTYSVAMNAWRRRERDDKIEYVLIEELPPSRQSTEGQPAGSLDAGIFAGATTGAADTAGSAPVLDGAQLPVSAIASEYLLTERERDVLMLLTQGRDVPTIARQLFISENTVRTHTKNIYIKMNIHSKQELLDRVEEYQ